MALAGAEARETTVDPVDEALRQSQSTFRSPRMFDAEGTDAVDGAVHWKPGKSLWISGMTLAALIGGPGHLHLGRAGAVPRHHRNHRLPGPLARHASPPHPPGL